MLESKEKYRILIADCDTQFLTWLQLIIADLEKELKLYDFHVRMIHDIKELIIPNHTIFDLAFVDESFVMNADNSFLQSLNDNHPNCLLVMLMSSKSKFNLDAILQRLKQNHCQIFAGYILKDNYSLQTLKTICLGLLEKMISQKA